MVPASTRPGLSTFSHSNQAREHNHDFQSISIPTKPSQNLQTGKHAFSDSFPFPQCHSFPIPFKFPHPTRSPYVSSTSLLPYIPLHSNYIQIKDPKIQSPLAKVVSIELKSRRQEGKRTAVEKRTTKEKVQTKLDCLEHGRYVPAPFEESQTQK